MAQEEELGRQCVTPKWGNAKMDRSWKNLGKEPIRNFESNKGGRGSIEQFRNCTRYLGVIMEVETATKVPNRHCDDLEIPTKYNGKKVKYGEAIKKFSVIKSQRGGKPENRGIWATLSPYST